MIREAGQSKISIITTRLQQGFRKISFSEFAIMVGRRLASTPVRNALPKGKRTVCKDANDAQSVYSSLAQLEGKGKNASNFRPLRTSEECWN